ncbi:hypothetical protein BSKO_00694 [Bryopsis sp. KO-2023]|nr:hypothetical protein BSKO_00694 [Bryopsis sp. KO-2023]
MDDLFSAARYQIGYEGRTGCTVEKLWELVVEALPVGGVKTLNDRLKQLIWKNGILTHPEDILFWTEAEENLDDEVVEGKQNYLLPTSPIVQNEGIASEYDVRLVASESFREIVFGLHEAKTSRFKISEPQMLALEAIAKARERGVLQSNLAKQLNIEHQNFFFVVKCLLCRDLITKNPIVVRRDDNNERVVSGHSATSVLHLRGFAPKVMLKAFQVFKMVNENTNANPGEATYQMQDDAKWMSLVCEKISSTSDKLVIESDLKLILGFRKTKGHRLWRRLKKKMTDCGLIETFIGSVERKPVTCIRQLMSYDDWVRQDRLARLKSPIFGPESTVYAENTLDRQIFDKVVEAGPEGLTTVDIFSLFQLNSKNNGHRLKAMSQNYEMVVQAGNVGKSFVNRCIAMCHIKEGPDLQINAPPPQPGEALPLPSVHPPQGSWMKGVVNAIMAGAPGNLLPVVPPPPISIMPEVPLLTQGSPGPSQPPETPRLDDDDFDPPTPFSGPMPSYPDPKEATQSVRRFLCSRIIGSHTDFRTERLVEKLNVDKFIIQSHVKAYIRDLELSLGYNVQVTGPERKTVTRLVEKVVRLTGAKKVTVSVLSKRGGAAKLMDVIVHPAVVLNEALLKEIREVNCNFEKVIRQRAHIKCWAQSRQALGEEIPVMDKITRLFPDRPKHGKKTKRVVPIEGEGDAFAQMHDNGFITAKMIRAKLLHYLICRMVGLGGFQPSPDLLVDKKQHQLPAWTDPKYKLPTNGDENSEKFIFASHHTYKETADVHIGVNIVVTDVEKGFKFTPRHLWDFMPMELFLQIVGTTKKLEGLDQLCNQYQTMSELPEERQKEVIDSSSRGRLSDLLDILCRMGLIESIVAASTSCVGLHKCSKFAVSKTGILEEPVADENVGPGEMPTISKKRQTFNLLEPGPLDKYWTHMEYVFTGKREQARTCFPANKAPEVCSRTGWVTNRLMSMSQWLQLCKRMDAEKDYLDWIKCRDIANDLGLCYNQVLQLSYERRRKYRLERLRAGEANLPRGRKKGGKNRFKKPSKAKPKRRKKQSTTVRQRALRVKRKKEARAPTLPILPKTVGDALVSDYGASDAQLTDIDMLLAMDNEDAMSDAIVPRRMRNRSGYWYYEEDRKLLSAFFAWRCSSRPPKSGARWRDMVGLPCGRTVNGLARCKRRYMYLRRNEQILSMMESMERLAEEIYTRRVARLPVDDTAVLAKELTDTPRDKAGDAGTDADVVQSQKRPREAVDEVETQPDAKQRKLDGESGIAEAPSGDPAGSNATGCNQPEGMQIDEPEMTTPAVRRSNLQPASSCGGMETIDSTGPPEADVRNQEPGTSSVAAPHQPPPLENTTRTGVDNAGRDPCGSRRVPSPNEGAPSEQDIQRRDALERLQGMDALDILVQQCHPDDTPLLIELRSLVNEAALKAPRATKHLKSRKGRKRREPKVVLKKKRLPSLGSTIVAKHNRMKDKYAIRLGRRAFVHFRGDGSASLAVAIAKDFALSLMYLSEKQEFMTAAMATVLSSKFEDKEIFNAFGLLNEQGWVNPGGSRRPLQLSRRFRILRIKEFNPDLFAQASSAAEIVWNLGISQQHQTGVYAHPLVKLIDEEGVLTVTKTVDLTGGDMACLTAAISEETVELEPVLSSAQNQDREGDSFRLVGGISPIVSVRIVGRMDPANDGHTSDHSRSGSRKGRRSHPHKRRFSDMLKASKPKLGPRFPAGMVGRCEKFREKAQAAMMSDAETTGTDAPLDKLLQMLRTAGSNGLALDDMPVHSNTHAKENVENGMQVLCEYGLARKFPGFTEHFYVASENAQKYVISKPEEAEEGPSQRLQSPSSQTRSRRSPGRGGAGAGPVDVQLSPWIDHEGCVNTGLLKMLQESLLAGIIGAPGIPEADLCERISFINPASAQLLLQLMVKQELCFVRVLEGAEEGPPSFFRSRRKLVRNSYYFPNMATCFSTKLPCLEGIEHLGEK